MANTALAYFYRDACNDKTFIRREVLAGGLSRAEIAEIEAKLRALDDVPENDYRSFIPSELGLPDAQVEFLEKGYGYDEGIDHPYCELVQIEPTAESPTVTVSIGEFLVRLRELSRWDAATAEARLQALATRYPVTVEAVP